MAAEGAEPSEHILQVESKPQRSPPFQRKEGDVGPREPPSRPYSCIPVTERVQAPMAPLNRAAGDRGNVTKWTV